MMSYLTSDKSNIFWRSLQLRLNEVRLYVFSLGIFKDLEKGDMAWLYMRQSKTYKSQTYKGCLKEFHNGQISLLRQAVIGPKWNVIKVKEELKINLISLIQCQICILWLISDESYLKFSSYRNTHPQHMGFFSTWTLLCLQKEKIIMIFLFLFTHLYSRTSVTHS